MKLPHWLRHDWGNWYILDQGNIFEKSELDGWTKRLVGKFITQTRKCKVCDYTELTTTNTKTIS